MFQLVQTGTDPNTGSAICALQGLNAEPLQCLIRALQREARQGDRYVATDLLRAIQEPEEYAKIKAQYDAAPPVYRYRWQELAGNQPGAKDGPVNEIWGTEESLYRVAKRIELPPRPFRSILIDSAGNTASFGPPMTAENTPDYTPREQPQF
jgi:hypothetical protein